MALAAVLPLCWRCPGGVAAAFHDLTAPERVK